MATPEPKKRLACVGTFVFPDSSAPGARVLALCRAFAAVGYDVLIGSGQREVAPTTEPFFVTALSEIPDRSHSRLARALRQFTWGRRTIEWLDSLDPAPEAVLLMGGYVPYAARLIPWCKRRHVALIVDVVEWFQPSHLPGGHFGPFYWNVELALRHYYPKAKNIIAISSFLERHFVAKGCRVMRMPPAFDTRDCTARCTSTSSSISLAYAGVPGKKDKIDNVVEALLVENAQQTRVELRLAGPSPEEVLTWPSLRRRGMSSLPNWLTAYGRVSHDAATEIVRSAEFTVLLRPSERYAQAGFPTKVVESLTVGTPVICNMTSDLASYLRDGVDALVCPDSSLAAFSSTLKRALNTNPAQRSAMRMAARHLAETAFDYRNYVNLLRSFIQSAVKEIS